MSDKFHRFGQGLGFGVRKYMKEGKALGSVKIAEEIKITGEWQGKPVSEKMRLTAMELSDAYYSGKGTPTLTPYYFKMMHTGRRVYGDPFFQKYQELQKEWDVIKFSRTLENNARRKEIKKTLKYMKSKMGVKKWVYTRDDFRRRGLGDKDTKIFAINEMEKRVYETIQSNIHMNYAELNLSIQKTLDDYLSQFQGRDAGFAVAEEFNNYDAEYEEKVKYLVHLFLDKGIWFTKNSIEGMQRSEVFKKYALQHGGEKAWRKFLNPRASQIRPPIEKSTNPYKPRVQIYELEDLKARWKSHFSSLLDRFKKK